LGSTVLRFSAGVTGVPAGQLDRDAIMSTAKSLSDFSWVVPATAINAPCLGPPKYSGVPYRSDFDPGSTEIGMPYDWGGMDTIQSFQEKMRSKKYAAGSHKEHECKACIGHCTAGIDCSGFVSSCWRLDRHYGTIEIGRFGAALPRGFNIFADLKRGDALVKPGEHIVLFDQQAPNGDPVVYEAVGRPISRVMHRTHKWADFEGYSPLRYTGVID